jgi:hypothetical protein
MQQKSKSLLDTDEEMRQAMKRMMLMRMKTTNVELIDIISVEAVYEVLNGLLGCKRDIVIKLICQISENQKTRAVVGMCNMIVEWKNTQLQLIKNSNLQFVGLGYLTEGHMESEDVTFSGHLNLDVRFENPFQNFWHSLNRDVKDGIYSLTISVAYFDTTIVELGVQVRDGDDKSCYMLSRTKAMQTFGSQNDAKCAVLRPAWCGFGGVPITVVIDGPKRRVMWRNGMRFLPIRITKVPDKGSIYLGFGACRTVSFVSLRTFQRHMQVSPRVFANAPYCDVEWGFRRKMNQKIK